MVCINGATVAFMKVNGRTIICMGAASSSGQTDASMTVSTEMIKWRALEFIRGLMANNTKVVGSTANITAKAYIASWARRTGAAFGKMASVLNGYKTMMVQVLWIMIHERLGK